MHGDQEISSSNDEEQEFGSTSIKQRRMNKVQEENALHAKAFKPAPTPVPRQ